MEEGIGSGVGGGGGKEVFKGNLKGVLLVICDATPTPPPPPHPQEKLTLSVKASGIVLGDLGT